MVIRVDLKKMLFFYLYFSYCIIALCGLCHARASALFENSELARHEALHSFPQKSCEKARKKSLPASPAIDQTRSHCQNVNRAPP